jgi:hypothetical protein
VTRGNGPGERVVTVELWELETATGALAGDRRTRDGRTGERDLKLREHLTGSVVR